MPPEPLWTLERVSLGTRLRCISLAIEPGVTAVIGWSGAGKTSLLNLLSGFESPASGTLRAPKSIFWVPQNFGLWPHLTARAHLAAMRAPAAKIDGLLAAFDLTARAAARPAELSQGECSRLAVARALLSGAPALVMDEPLAHVDPARVGKYWSVIREHIAQTDASLIFSTHEPETALGEATRAICLDAGELLHTGPVAELYDNPETPRLMELLGPGNWLEPADAALWLGHETPSCVRPERLTIQPDENGPRIVESACFRGATAEATLRHESGAARKFFHRPATARLEAGMRVLLRFLSVLALAFGGCTDHAAELRPAEIHAWALPPVGATLPAPRSVAAGPRGEIAVLDTAGRVLIFDETGALQRQWSMPETSVGRPEGLVFLDDGRIVVCDTHYHRVVWFSSNGEVVRMIGREGSGPREFIYPVGIAKDDQENLYICEYGGHDRVQKLTREGEFIGEFGGFGTGPGEFQRPSGLAWRAGELFVADAINNRILVFSDTGEYRRIFAPAVALDLPYDIAFARHFYVIEYGAGRITRLTAEGALAGRFGKTGGGEGEFATPWGLDVDRAGTIFVADTKNRRIVRLRLAE